MSDERRLLSCGCTVAEARDGVRAGDASGPCSVHAPAPSPREAVVSEEVIASEARRLLALTYPCATFDPECYKTDRLVVDAIRAGIALARPAPREVTNEMVERAAKAYYGLTGPWEPWENTTQRVRDAFLKDTRRALTAALREAP